MIVTLRRAHGRGVVDDVGARRHIRQVLLQNSGHRNEVKSLVGHDGCGRRALQVIDVVQYRMRLT